MAQDKATSLEDKIAEMKQNFKTKEQEAKESHDKTVQVSYRIDNDMFFFIFSKDISSLALKLINNCWIKTGSQPC